MSKWIRPARVRGAIAALNQWRIAAKSQPAMHIWPLLALLDKGVNKTTPVMFEEADDRQFWDRYARVPGDTRSRADDNAPGGFTTDFYIEPLLLEKRPSDYYHRSPATIRDRTFLNSWKAATFNEATKEWKLADNFADIFVNKVLTRNGVAYRIPVVDLASWLFKGEDFPDASTSRTLEQRLKLAINLSEGDYGKLFEYRDEDSEHIFTTDKPSDDEYRTAIEELLVPTGTLIPAEPPVQDGPSTDDTTAALKDDDVLLAQVRKLILLGTSGIILRGCPGTSKTWYAKQIASRLVESDSHIFKVQFHPSYGYEDFVEGYQPSESATSGFEIVDKVFLKACDTAAALPKTSLVVFIIDEINRGDPARIFGELLTYIEHGYRGDTFSRAYTGKPAKVPANLVLLGTMNPHDKSIMQLDAALVRRFDHITLNPSSETAQEFLERSQGFSGDQIDRVVKWFEALQRLIPDGIGHTYLKDVTNAEQLQTVWQYRMWPYCESVLELEPDNLENVKRCFESMYRAVVGQQTDED